MEWISVKDKLPEAKMGWSCVDVLCLCLYSYEIGRTRNGKWVNMNNRVIDVTHWMHLPEPPHSPG